MDFTAWSSGHAVLGVRRDRSTASLGRALHASFTLSNALEDHHELLVTSWREYISCANRTSKDVFVDVEQLGEGDHLRPYMRFILTACHWDSKASQEGRAVPRHASQSRGETPVVYATYCM